jgi:2-keto-4-pentenoate hydratase/2-oxohepta-3-ene-1,7-dioic acid hydratase in catechol pathway
MRTPEWALVQYRLPGDTRTRAGARTGDGTVYAVDELGGETLLDALAHWDEVAAALAGWSPAAGVPGMVADARLVAPLTYPGKVLCSGANYYSHAAEMGVAAPDPEGEPFFFLKPPATTVIGPGEPIPCPATALLDWEAELGVVIGRRAKDVLRENAFDFIAGYLVANDVSARDRTAREDAVSPHFVYDWLAHKGQDGFCPLGPGIVPAWQVEDPQQLQLRLSVNGVVRQDCSTADMVITVDRLVAAASRLCTLLPGDVILTGTPAGVGVPRGEFLHPGDIVRIEIDGIGMLENPVVAA